MARTPGKAPQHKLAKAVRDLLPNVTLADFEAILSIARSGHLRHLPASIIAWQATTSHIRHAHTDYDALLEEGYDPDAARFFVVDEMNETLARWGCLKRVGEDAIGRE